MQSTSILGTLGTVMGRSSLHVSLERSYAHSTSEAHS